jgi:hypothetical protein
MTNGHRKAHGRRRSRPEPSKPERSTEPAEDHDSPGACRYPQQRSNRPRRSLFLGHRVHVLIGIYRSSSRGQAACALRTRAK